MELIYYGLIAGVLSLAGGLLVIWRVKEIKKIMTSLLSFAAAAFLGVSFLDLLPEAVLSVDEPHAVFIAFLIGVTVFFILERSLMKYLNAGHEHTESDDHTESLPALIILGDSMHNFLDGMAIVIAYIAVWYVLIYSFASWLPYLLAGVAGMFTYIALSELVPEIHHRARHKHLYRVLVPFIAGLLLIGYLVTF